MIGKIILIGATWILSDAIYSFTLYLNAPSYEGSRKQTFRRDHWVRLVRGCWALVFIFLGFILEV